MKNVVIFSGGLDSTVLLHKIAKESSEIHGLSFNYGQRHKKELDFAKIQAAALCTSWQMIDISFLSGIASASALTDHSLALPLEHYTHNNQKITVVPNRNMVMLSIAIALAENNSCDSVYFGPHANDFAIYPDCRPEFVEQLSRASELATYNRIKVFAPFVNMKKSDIVMLGAKLGVDFSATWSCYAGGEQHCGKCATCQERKEAFVIAGIADPTVYAE